MKLIGFAVCMSLLVPTDDVEPVPNCPLYPVPQQTISPTLVDGEVVSCSSVVAPTTIQAKSCAKDKSELMIPLKS